MAIKPEDKPKLIGLGAALIGVFGYVLVILVPKLTAGASPPHADLPPPPPLTQAAVQAPITPATGAAAPGAVPEPSAAMPDDESGPIPQMSRDTFVPPPVATNPQAPGSPSQPAKPAASAPANSGPSLGPAAPNGTAPGAAPTAPVVVQAPPLPNVELKGVILGEPAVAVLSVNGEVMERQVGEWIVNGLKLAKISDVGVTVLAGKRYMPVTVGHAMLTPVQPGSISMQPQAPVQQAMQQPAAAPALVKATR